MFVSTFLLKMSPQIHQVMRPTVVQPVSNIIIIIPALKKDFVAPHVEHVLIKNLEEISVQFS